ncbi:MAG: CHAT domain-containing protein [Planctomycetales bacterium]|nr:CHAT domain-containing protein [Planctomycetales bacterium]
MPGISTSRPAADRVAQVERTRLPQTRLLTSLLALLLLTTVNGWRRTAGAADRFDLDVAAQLVAQHKFDEAATLLGDLLVAIDQGTVAETYRTRTLDLLADTELALGKLPDAQVHATDYHRRVQAQQELDTVIRKRLLQENLIRLGLIAEHEGQFSRADRHYTRVLHSLGDAVSVQRLELTVRRARLAQHQPMLPNGDQDSGVHLWQNVRDLAVQLLADVQQQSISDRERVIIYLGLVDAYEALEDWDRVEDTLATAEQWTKQIHDDHIRVQVLVRSGEFQRARQNWPAAQTAYQQAMQIHRSVQGGLLDRASLEFVLAEIEHAQEHWPAAKTHYASAAEFYAQAIPAKRRDAAPMHQLGNWAVAAERSDNLALARELLRLVVARYGSVGNKGSAENQEAAANTGAASSEASRPHLSQSMLQARIQYSRICRVTGQVDEAKAIMYDASLNHFLKAAPVPAASLFDWRMEQGKLALTLKQTKHAQQFFNVARHVALEKSPDDAERIGMAHVFLGVAYQDDYVRATDSFREAIQSFQSLGPPGHALQAAAYFRLGLTYLSQGQNEQAFAATQQALQLYQQPASGPSPEIVNVYHTLADISLEADQVADAERYVNQALTICQHLNIDDTTDAASTWHRAAKIAYVSGKLTTATEHWQRALRIQQRVDQASIPRTLNWLGKTARELNDLPAAERYFQKSYDLQTQGRLFPVRFYLTSCWLAQIWDVQGKSEAAKRLLTDAVQFLEVPRTNTVGSESERAENFARFATAYDLLISWSLRDGDTSAAMRYAEQSRNRTFLDQLALDGVDLRATLTGEQGQKLRLAESQLDARLSALQLRYDELIRIDDENALADVTQQLIQTRRQWYDVWKEIRNASPLYRERLATARERSWDLTKAHDYLRETNQLCLFYMFDQRQGYLVVWDGDPSAISVYPLEIPAKAALFLHVPAGAITREMMQSIVGQYLRELRNREGGRGLAGIVTGNDVESGTDAGVALARVLIPDEVRKRIQSARPQGIVIVPDGALHQLPFESLLLDYRRDLPTYLLDTFPPLTYVPSLAILQNLLDRPQSTSTANTLLTVGPTYPPTPPKQDSDTSDDQLDRSSFLHGRLPPLKSNQEECRQVARVFQEQGFPVEQLLGTDATEPRVRAAIGGKRFVHLAAHGLVDQQLDNCFGSLALTAPPTATTAQADGYLQQREIQTLPMSDCELAVLSACQTVAGPNRPQEAGTSLAQAFLLAGSRRVVCSHWNVNDDATAVLVAEFLRLVAQQTNQEDGRIRYAWALHQAKRNLRAQDAWSSPRFWAPFVLVGPSG